MDTRGLSCTSTSIASLYPLLAPDLLNPRSILIQLIHLFATVFCGLAEMQFNDYRRQKKKKPQKKKAAPLILQTNNGRDIPCSTESNVQVVFIPSNSNPYFQIVCKTNKCSNNRGCDEGACMNVKSAEANIQERSRSYMEDYGCSFVMGFGIGGL
ncbi:unnamed protein product [Onchocerca flexuosa]|uniref:AWS domain-containing protein n=1 Tax=Onchocerca flexuosa TaxID=387005 RepID=A0A183GYX2_9BILA|nr:unnamed protein product [Onchocerca flexuosa]